MNQPKPPIDRENAADVEDDPPAPTVENLPPFRFTPSTGLSSKELLEIACMTVVATLAPSLGVEPGAFRDRPIPAERFAQLSGAAQRHFTPVV